MKFTVAFTTSVCVLVAAQAFAQTSPAPATKSLASSAGLMVYPAKGQDAAAQSKERRLRRVGAEGEAYRLFGRRCPAP